MDEKPCKHSIVSFLSTSLCTTNFRLTVNCYSLLLLVCDKVLNSGALINYNFTRNLIQVSLLQKKLVRIFFYVWHQLSLRSYIFRFHFYLLIIKRYFVVHKPSPKKIKVLIFSILQLPTCKLG